MSKNFDRIATVDINIATRVVDNSAFDSLLIVGPAPKADTEVPAYAAYHSLKEVVSAGFVVDTDTPDPVGVAARIAFAQKPTPDTIYIAVIQEEEDVLQTVANVLGYTDWYVLCPAGVEASKYIGIAKLIEESNRLFAYTDMGGLSATAFSTELNPGNDAYYRTLGIFGKETAAQEEAQIPADNHYMHVAFVASWLSYHPGSETAAFKALQGMAPADLSDVEVAVLTNAGVNYFTAIGNRNVTMNGIVHAGEWADVIRFRDWLLNDMQTRVVSLFLNNPKLTYTNGATLIQNQMLASLKAGQDAGGILEDEYDENGNVTPGYVTSVPAPTAITAADKMARKLPGCKFSARLAGAVHVTDVTGTLSYDI